MGRRQALAAIVGAAIPLLVSQLLPSDNPDRWSPIALSLLAAAGALAGYVWPTARGWVAVVVWTVVGSALILLSWTDLVLDVSPSVLLPDTWRNEVIAAIASALAIVSGGFVVGRLLARRAQPRLAARTLPLVAATVAGTLFGGALVAAVFARTSVVVQPGEGLVTVLVSDSGLDVQPATIGARSYQVVIENRTTRPLVVSGVVPINVSDGLSRAMTAAEIDAWRAGTWDALGEPFRQALRSREVVPASRTFGGFLQVRAATDDGGGVLWYVAESGAVRRWPGESEEPMVPWPAIDDVVQPVVVP